MPNRIQIFSDSFKQSLITAAGVYRIYSLNEDRTGKEVSRLLDVDNSGLLYIGESSNLKPRLEMLIRVLSDNYKANAHTFGLKYFCSDHIKAKYPKETLFIETFNDLDHKNTEARLLEEYFNIFGEFPPFNSSCKEFTEKLKQVKRRT